MAADSLREKALGDYRKKLLEHKELESRLKESKLDAVLMNNSIISFNFIQSNHVIFEKSDNVTGVFMQVIHFYT